MTAPSTDHPLVAYALAAAARGWHVFPLALRAKQPRRGFAGWEANATTDPGKIRAMWARDPYNLGIACGPSNLVVLDLDVPKGGEHPPEPFRQEGVTCGADVLALLCEQNNRPLPTDTFTVRTQRGGIHLYFTAPDGLRLGNTTGRLGWLIDTRAHGGYVVGPGSIVRTDTGDGHYTVGSYTVANTAPAAALPGWLAERLTPASQPPQEPVSVAVADDRHGAYLRAAVEAEIARVADSPPQGHNTALYRAAVALGQLVAGGELNEPDVTGWLQAAGEQVGQPPGEAAATIASGLKAGAKRPRSIAA